MSTASETKAAEVATQAILQAQARFWRALQDKDRATLERVLAEDFVARYPGEANQTRLALIETLVGFPGKATRVGSDNLEVHLFGDVGVITGVQSAQLELPNGQIVQQTMAITNVLQRIGDEWLMKVSHAVELPQRG